MEHFNHKFNRLQKELVDITLNLNKFKTENHSTLTRIIDNLSSIPKHSNIQTINKDNNAKIGYSKTSKPNNNRKKLFYTKKSISLEKNSQYPFYDQPRNIRKNYLSTTTLKYRDANKNKKRPNTGNLNDKYKNSKEKNFIKNENKIDFLKEKDEDNILYGKFNKFQIDKSSAYKSNKYDDESAYSIININNSKERMKRLNKYKEINNKFLLDKENQNINNDYNFNNNYNIKKNDKDNAINIYSYNHYYNSNRSNNLNFNYNIPYNELLSKYTNDINKNGINEEYLISNKKKDNLEENIKRIDLNNIGYNHSNKLDNKIINNVNNISQKMKTDNSFKEFYVNDNNLRNNQKINILKEKLLINKNNDERKNFNYINDDIIKAKNDNENNHDNENKIQIFKNLGVNNIEEAKIKIRKLKIYQKFYDEIKKIYLGYKKENKNYNSNNMLLWIYEISKYYSDSNYISFFEDIMKEYDIKSFEEFKIIINDYINHH